MDIPTRSVHKIEKRDDGSFRVTLSPDQIDETRSYGSQLTIDRFTPDTGDVGPDYYNGTLGDPEVGDQATLEIDHVAVRANRRRRMSKAALTGGVLHEPEGVLYLPSSNDQPS